MICPFCSSPNMQLVKTNGGRDMHVITDYECSEELFQVDVVLVNCGNSAHGFFTTREDIKDLSLPIQDWDKDDAKWLEEPLTDEEQLALDQDDDGEDF